MTANPKLGSVVVIGPNLRTPDSATFHIHRTECADIRRYGFGPLGGEVNPPTRYTDLKDLVEDFYQDIIEEQDDTSVITWAEYADEFRVFPCVETTKPEQQQGKTKMNTTRAPKSVLAAAECACGCGEVTARQFAAGHDNRLYGQVRRGEKPETALDPYPGLVRKLDRAKWADERKADRKAEKETIEAIATPSAEALQAQTVKVGRWTYDVVATEPVDDGLVRVTFRTKDGQEKTANVPPRALS